MIRVLGVYYWKSGASFNHEYYHAQHMKLAKSVLKKYGLVRLESDSFEIGDEPKEGDIIAASNAYFVDAGSAMKAMSEAGTELLADLSNYTTIQPDIKLAQVSVHM